jgi:hypothetical protein
MGGDTARPVGRDGTRAHLARVSCGKLRASDMSRDPAVVKDDRHWSFA